MIDAGNTSVRVPAQIWGSPEINDDVKVWLNSGYLFGGGQQLYLIGNYASKTVDGGFYYPAQRPIRPSPRLPSKPA